jgi:hypothetical protein
MGTLVVRVPAGTSARVSQVRHEFWFGAAPANQLFTPQADADLVAKYKEVFLATLCLPIQSFRSSTAMNRTFGPFAASAGTH